MNFYKRFFGHIKTVMKHKYWVWYYMNKCGFKWGWRGLWHDMSKFSPIEFWESVKYYSGTRSPIDACKEENGISMAWMHHKGRNPHHYEYWQDNFDKGGEAKEMPWKYKVEMICDYLGAADILALMKEKGFEVPQWAAEKVAADGGFYAGASAPAYIKSTAKAPVILQLYPIAVEPVSEGVVHA